MPTQGPLHTRSWARFCGGLRAELSHKLPAPPVEKPCGFPGATCLPIPDGVVDISEEEVVCLEAGLNVLAVALHRTRVFFCPKRMP